MPLIKKKLGEYFFVILTIIMGLTASVGLSIAEYRAKEYEIREQFRVAASDRIRVITRALEANIAVSHSVVAFFESSADVSRQEFARFTSQILKDHPYIEALEWAPRIQSTDRARVEAAAAKIIEGYHFKDIADDGSLVAAAARSVYYPVLYVEPVTENTAQIFGTDFMTNPLRRKTLEIAMSSGQTTVTPKITLLFSRQPGVVFYSPVFRNDALGGFITSVIRLNTIVAKAIEPLSKEGVNILAYDVTDDTAKQEPLFIFSSRLQKVTDQEVLDLAAKSSLQETAIIDVAKRKWRISIIPSNGYFSVKGLFEPYIIFLIGIAFTGMLAHYMVRNLKENIRITREVEIRTRELERMARYDLLTGLANRRLFIELLQKSIARSKRLKTRVAVIYMDLNNFKPVNDGLGHAAGDALLKEFAVRCHRVLRQQDTAVRLGGDEFAIVMDDVHTPVDCEAVLARLLSALMQPFSLEGRPIELSASIGIALFPDNANTLDELIANADNAMYEAKKDKTKVYIFSKIKPESRPPLAVEGIRLEDS